jgi:hypothetical protein
MVDHRVGCVIWILLPPDSITPGRFRQIRLGMTQEEVQATIGLEPGDHYTGARGFGGITSRGPWASLRAEMGIPSAVLQKQQADGILKGRVLNWLGNRHAISVAFDEKGKAIGCYLMVVKGVDY